MVKSSQANSLNKSILTIGLTWFIQFIPISTNGQPTSWLSVDFLLDNYVTTMYNDTITNSLFIAGVFQHVDNIHCNSVLKYDASGISFIDTNNFVATPPHAIIRYDSTIYVGGFYGLHRLVNGQWDSIAFNSGFKVNDLLIEDSNLIVGGYFVDIGNQMNYGLARYDGITFYDYHGFPDEVPNWAEVGALVKFENELVVGGNIDTSITKEILSWDGSNWLKFGGGIPGIGEEWVSDMAVYHGELFVAGRFRKSWGSQGDNILKWSNGQWTEVGEGIQGVQEDVLKVYHGKLWVGGKFTKAGLVDCSNIAVWDGLQWCTPPGDLKQGISALEVYNDTLYVGGGFDMIDGDTTKRYLVKFNSDSPMKCDSTVGISESLGSEKILIYPNPSSGQFSIEFNSNLDGMIQIYDLLSTEIIRAEINGRSKMSFDLNTVLSNGFYQAKIITSKGSTTRRLLIRK